jgi:hypothetical protein
VATAINKTIDYPPVEPLESALGRLLELAALPGGWDSYGAAPVSPSARTAAAAMLLFAWQEGVVQQSGRPEIFPVPTGGLQFEWHGDNGEIEIEIAPNGSASSLIEWRNGTFEESPEGFAVKPADIVKLVKRVIF